MFPPSWMHRWEEESTEPLYIIVSCLMPWGRSLLRTAHLSSHLYFLFFGPFCCWVTFITPIVLQTHILQPLCFSMKTDLSFSKHISSESAGSDSLGSVPSPAQLHNINLNKAVPLKGIFSAIMQHFYRSLPLFITHFLLFKVRVYCQNALGVLPDTLVTEIIRE